jgi:hypothetical protein
MKKSMTPPPSNKMESMSDLHKGMKRTMGNGVSGYTTGKASVNDGTTRSKPGKCTTISGRVA